MSLWVVVSGGLCMAALGRVAWIDHRRFEISFAALATGLATGLAAIVLVEGYAGLVASVIGGAIISLSFAIVWWVKPKSIGEGDFWLFGAMGLLAGVEWMLPFILLLLVLVLPSAAIWSLMRGKRLFASMFPAAPPAVAALLPVFVARLVITPPTNWANLFTYWIGNGWTGNGWAYTALS